MPPDRAARPSRAGGIPHYLILRWKPEPNDRAKLVRRPMTACENCRAAKVKCTGPDCERCIARRLTCTHPTKSNRSPAVDTHSHMQTVLMSPPAVTEYLNDASAIVNEPVSSDMSATQQSSLPIPSAMEELQDGNGFNWGTMESPLDETFDSLLSPIILGPPEPIGASTVEVFPHGITSIYDNHHPSAPTTQAASTTNHTASTGYQTSVACLCKANLPLCVPKITSAMQNTRLDEVLKVTGEVFRCCQEIMNCRTCQVRCSDLLLMMTVLQETHPCLDHMAKSGIDAVKVSFGEYEVLSNDDNMRAILVMDLVNRANAVLVSISAKGQSMIDELSELSSLAKANIAYLEATINQFRSILRCVTRYVTGTKECPQAAEV